MIGCLQYAFEVGSTFSWFCILNGAVVKRLINWLLSSSVFAAACSLSLCVSAEKLALGYIPPFFTPLHFIIVGSSLFEYNVHRLFNPHVHQGLSTNWNIGLAAVGALFCVCSLPFLSVHFLAWLAVLGVFTISYSLPLFKRRLKDYGLVKITVLTAVWVIATTVLPTVYWQRPHTFFWWKIALRTELIFALCLAFDIRDVQHDASRKVQTLASRLGIQQSYNLTSIVLLFFLFTGILQFYFEQSLTHLIAILLTCIAAFAAIAYSRKHEHNNVYLGLIDGVMLVYGLMLLL